MPLFEIGNDELVPFRRVQAGPELYEQEIEGLLWSNLEAFVGVPLFPVARQPTLSDGLRPDIVALDDGGHVHVVEVKRDIAVRRAGTENPPPQGRRASRPRPNACPYRLRPPLRCPGHLTANTRKEPSSWRPAAKLPQRETSVRAVVRQPGPPKGDGRSGVNGVTDGALPNCYSSRHISILTNRRMVQHR